MYILLSLIWLVGASVLTLPTSTCAGRLSGAVAELEAHGVARWRVTVPGDGRQTSRLMSILTRGNPGLDFPVDERDLDAGGLHFTVMGRARDLRAFAERLHHVFPDEEPRVRVLPDPVVTPVPAAAASVPRVPLPPAEIISDVNLGHLARVHTQTVALLADPARLMLTSDDPGTRRRLRLAPHVDLILELADRLRRTRAEHAAETDPDLREIHEHDYAADLALQRAEWAHVVAILNHGFGEATSLVEIAQSGPGDRENEDVALIARMYVNLAKISRWTAEQVEVTDGAWGPRRVLLRLSGRDVATLAETEPGSHRVHVRNQAVDHFRSVRVTVDGREERDSSRSATRGERYVRTYDLRTRHEPTSLLLRGPGLRTRLDAITDAHVTRELARLAGDGG